MHQNTDCAAIPNAPRSLHDPTEVVRRRQLLRERHIAPLTDYVAALRLRNPNWEFPDFDPLDGGIDADLLFLLEKPGPMTSPEHKRRGSGFISRDNNDATAEAVFSFMKEAGIDRKRTVLWNTIPGWNGKREIAPGEIGAGIEELLRLLELLPRVSTVVLVGKRAQKAEAIFQRQDLRVFRSAHPSPLVKGPNYAMWRRIPQQWAEAARFSASS